MFSKKFSSNMRRKKRTITSIFILLIIFLGIGYSAISTDLGISGDLNVSKYSQYPITIDLVETSTPESPEGYDVGERFEFDIVIKNVKNDVLTDLVITSEETGDEITMPMVYEKAEETESTFFTVTDLEPESNIITVTVTGIYREEEFTVSKQIAVPVIGIINDLTLDVEVSPPAVGDSYSLNEEVNFTVTVTNTGTTRLEGINVSIPDGSTPVSLNPGISQVFEYSTRISETDIAMGKAIYEFSATATRAGETVVEKTKTIELNVNQ